MSEAQSLNRIFVAQLCVWLRNTNQKVQKKPRKKERDKRKRKVCNPQCWNTWITLFIAGQVSETHTSWRSHILLYPRAGGVVNVAVFQPDRKHCVYVLIIWKAWARGPSSHTDSFLIRPRLPVRKKKTQKKNMQHLSWSDKHVALPGGDVWIKPIAIHHEKWVPLAILLITDSVISSAAF